MFFVDAIDETKVFVEIIEADRVLLHMRRRHLGEAKTDGQDQAGEPHSADRGGKQLLVLRRSAGQVLAIGTQERKASHMIAEGTAGMVVLAVDIVGKRAANGDKSRTWCHGKKEAVRNGAGQNVAKGNAGFAGHHPCARIEGDYARVSTVVDQHAAIVMAAVAVAAAVAERQEGIGLDIADAIFVVVG